MTAGTISGPDETRSAHADLLRLFGSNLIVIGFFTPDYAEAASTFAANLIEHRVSHHLYACAKVEGGWRAQIFQKPAMLAVARRDYPDAVLVFMDVDCSIRGDISKIVETRGDVALRVKGTGGRTGLCAEVQLPRHRRHADPGWRRVRRRLEFGVPGPRNGNGICFGSDHRTQRRRLFARGLASALRRHGIARCSRRCGHRA